MTHDIFEDAARAFVGLDGKQGAGRARPKPKDRLMRAAEKAEGAVAQGAAALRDTLVRGLAAAACSHVAIPLDEPDEKPERR